MLTKTLSFNSIELYSDYTDYKPDEKKQNNHSSNFTFSQINNYDRGLLDWFLRDMDKKRLNRCVNLEQSGLQIILRNVHLQFVYGHTMNKNMFKEFVSLVNGSDYVTSVVVLPNELIGDDNSHVIWTNTCKNQCNFSKNSNLKLSMTITDYVSLLMILDSLNSRCDFLHLDFSHWIVTNDMEKPHLFLSTVSLSFNNLKSLSISFFAMKPSNQMHILFFIFKNRPPKLSHLRISYYRGELMFLRECLAEYYLEHLEFSNCAIETSSRQFSYNPLYHPLFATSKKIQCGCLTIKSCCSQFLKSLLLYSLTHETLEFLSFDSYNAGEEINKLLENLRASLPHLRRLAENQNNK